MTTIDSQIDSSTTQRPSRRRFTARDRKRLIGMYERSGQNAVEFCRENDVSTSSLWRWLARAREPEPEREEGNAGRLVEIPMRSLRAPDEHAAAVTMQLTDGARLEIVAGTDTAWLGALVRALTPGSV
jgi:transposase-like protein